MENSSFLALPYEILSMVIIQTVPESIENISLTCKFLYHASAAALAEHQQLKRRYSLLDVFHPDLFLAFTGEYPESEMSLTAVDYLQNIALDPRLSSYPTSVILRNGWGDYSFSGETNKKFEDKMARLIHIIQEQASFRNLFSSKFDKAHIHCELLLVFLVLSKFPDPVATLKMCFANG